jgi:hypothetical protein
MLVVVLSMTHRVTVRLDDDYVAAVDEISAVLLRHGFNGIECLGVLEYVKTCLIEDVE